MKKGDKIRFKVVEYTANGEVKRRTDQVLEGTVLYVYDGNYTVKVHGKKLPFFVEPDSIVKEA